MTFTIANLMDSIAGVLKTGYPDCPVYLGPNQQGTDYPCFFIFLMPSTIMDEPGGRYFRDLGLDVVYVQERNAVGGNKEIQAVQEYLDEHLLLFDYSDGAGTVPLHTYERQASTEDQELHYKFHIRQRVSLPTEPNPMQLLEENDVTEKK